MGDSHGDGSCFLVFFIQKRTGIGVHNHNSHFFFLCHREARPWRRTESELNLDNIGESPYNLAMVRDNPDALGKKNLKSVFSRLQWDSATPVSEEDLFLFLMEEKPLAGLDRPRLLARLLQSARWYELIDLFGMKRLRGFLSDEVLRNIWIPGMRNHYEYIRSVLDRALSANL